MKRTLQIIVAATLLLTLNHLISSSAFAQGTAFTYQGQLQNNGSPASGTYNLTFTLFATNTGGAAVAGPVTNSAVAVTNGLFTVAIDFGAGVWNGQTNWLEIGVETNNASSFATLAPRQQVTPTPYAITAESISGTLPASQLTSVGNYSFFVGPSGNSTTTGFADSATGVGALHSNTSGSDNTGNGANALYNNTIGSYNTAAGTSALGDNTTGNNNTADGVSALGNNTSGSYNTADGLYALVDNSTGNYNTAIGQQAMYNNTTGSFNTASGDYALFGNTNGAYNTADGFLALYNNTVGSFNTANGYNALYNNTYGYNNVANGVSALYYNTFGYYNTANGYNALYFNVNGIDNTANGAEALYDNTGGNNNTANGYQALYGNTLGSCNTANGYDALYANTFGTYNTANGGYALYDNTIGNNNTANGYNALYSNTTGYNNTANGSQALYSNTNGFSNTANGYDALYYNINGYANTANGASALGANTNGLFNTADGASALGDNTSGSYNAANGADALFKNTTGNYNTASGVDVLFANTNGSDNTADGYFALGQLGSSGASGTNNIALGYYAGYAFTNNESSNIDIGNIGVAGESGVIRIGTPGVQTATYLAGSVGIGTPSVSELLQIGSISNAVDGMIRLGCGNGAEARLWDIGVPYGNANNTGTNYSFIIRDASVGSLRFMVDWKTGDVCIGTNTPLGLLTVGSAYCNGTVWQNGSDRNSKEDFSPVSSGEVLAKVATLPITEWQYKVDAPGIEHLGPMAQDFHAAFGLNGPDDKHISTVDEGGVALAAIQGLNQKLEADNTELKQENTLLSQRLDELEAEVKALARNNR